MCFKCIHKYIVYNVFALQCSSCTHPINGKVNVKVEISNNDKNVDEIEFGCELATIQKMIKVIKVPTATTLPASRLPNLATQCPLLRCHEAH